MNWRIVKLDFIRNKAINLGLLLFIVFSATLTVISTIVAIQTFTSISRLYEVADPPHFLQMHKGDLDENQLQTFMDNDDRVEFYQTVTMIDIFGDQIEITNENETYSLSDFRLDIGLIKQNDTRDLLLDSNLNKVVIEKGSIGIPSLVEQMYDIHIGDTVEIITDDQTYTFVVSHIIVDAMMNSPLTSSTRILLNDDDFEQMRDQIGELEYLVEVYLFDRNDATAFETSYESANMPQNGQAVNYNIIFILSALTDVVTVFVLLLVSVLLILVSFICLKFTILAALEEEIHEIGTMKAIGLTYKDVSHIYMMKYRVLAIMGVFIGYLLSFFLSRFFTHHINATFGDTPLSVLAVVISLITALFVYIIITRYAKRILKRIKKTTVVDTLVKGIGFGKRGMLPKKGIYQSKQLNINVLLSIRETFYHFKGWAVVFFVMMITTTMILIPINLLHTFESPHFITYMGSSKEDILIEVAPGDQLLERVNQTKLILDNSQDVDIYYTYKTIRVQTTDIDDQIINFDIDTGDHSGYGLQYLQGEAPTLDNHIALSLLNAEAMGKKINEEIQVIIDDQSYDFIITGIYQDVTSGGYTAKAINTFNGIDGNKYTFSINLVESAQIVDVADQWTQDLPSNIKVYPMDAYIAQTLGGVSNQLRSLVVGIFVLTTLLALLINILFLRLRLIKDYSEVAILNAVGFSKKDIKKQYMFKVGLIVILGILCGLILTLLLENFLVKLGLSVASIGIKEVSLQINFLMMFIVTPSFLFVVSMLMTMIGLKKINTYKIMSLINE